MFACWDFKNTSKVLYPNPTGFSRQLNCVCMQISDSLRLTLNTTEPHTPRTWCKRTWVFVRKYGFNHLTVEFLLHRQTAGDKKFFLKQSFNNVLQCKRSFINRNHKPYWATFLMQPIISALWELPQTRLLCGNKSNSFPTLKPIWCYWSYSIPALV